MPYATPSRRCRQSSRLPNAAATPSPPRRLPVTSPPDTVACRRSRFTAHQVGGCSVSVVARRGRWGRCVRCVVSSGVRVGWWWCSVSHATLYAHYHATSAAYYQPARRQRRPRLPLRPRLPVTPPLRICRIRRRTTSLMSGDCRLPSPLPPAHRRYHYGGQVSVSAWFSRRHRRL